MMPKPFLLNAFSALMVSISLYLALNVSSKDGYLFYFSATSILACLILYKFFSSYKKTISFAFNNYLLFHAAFLIWASLSIFWSPVFSSSLSAITLIYFFPLGVIVGFWSNKEQQSYFYTLLIFILLAIFWKSTQQKFILFPSQQAYGFFSNKNTNGIFVCMILLPLCTQLIGKKINQFSQYTYGALLFIGAFVISLTISRGAVLGLTIGLILLLIHTLLHKLPVVNFFKIICYLGAGYFSAELINGSQNWHRITESTLTTNITSISSGRDSLWQSGWEMYLDRPFLGWGFDMFHWLFPQYRHAPDFGLYVHNDYFQFLIELGPIGLLLFIGFLLTFLLSGKKLYTLSPDQNDKLESLGLIAACIAILVHSFFTFNLYQSAPLLLLGLYIGVITQKLNLCLPKNNYCLQASESKFTTPKGYYGILSTVSLLLAFIVFLNIFGLKKLSGQYENKFIFLQEIENAHSLLPYEEHILAKQLYIYTDILYNQWGKLTLDARNFLIKGGIRTSTEAIDKNPYRVSSYTRRAELYMLATDKDYPERLNEINTAYTKAIQLNPFRLDTRITYASYLSNLNNKTAAINVLKDGLDRQYSGYYQQAIYYLQLLLDLLSATENQPAIDSLKQQIGEQQLRAKTARVGKYTLRAW